MDSPFAGKMLPEIQASIAAYNQLMSDPAFVEAKNMEQVSRAIFAFKSAIALDDRFEQYMPADNFSNFALRTVLLLPQFVLYLQVVHCLGVPRLGLFD